MSEQTYRVLGMSCGHCVGAVTDEVSKVAGVTQVRVDLDSGSLRIVSDQPVGDAAVRAAVEEAGYELADDKLAGFEGPG